MSYRDRPRSPGVRALLANETERRLQELIEKRDVEVRGITYGQDNPRNFYSIQPSVAGTDSFPAPANFTPPKLFVQPFPRHHILTALQAYQPLTQQGKKIIRSISPFVGQLSARGDKLGTGVLFNSRFVLTARHCIEGELIKNLVFQCDFGHINLRFNYVVEESKELDYAILAVKDIVTDKAFFRFNSTAHTDMGISNDTLLLHYPNGLNLQISGHSLLNQLSCFAPVNPYAVINHDSDTGSSGGVYLNAYGDITAIHLGIDIDTSGKSMSARLGGGSAERYALPISEIMKYAYSLLRGSHVIQQLAARGWQLPRYNILLFVERVADWEREGDESQIKFTQELKNSGHNLSAPAGRQAAGVTLTKKKFVSFKSAAVVRRLETKHPIQMAATVDYSLGQAGLHGKTHQYSIAGKIDSDHPLPHEVWKKTTNNKLKNVAVGAGKRAGEYNMPAITIPYNKHQDLKTTGSKAHKKLFRQSLITKCNNDNIKGALEDVIEDYKANALLGPTADPRYKNAWRDTLDLYEGMAIITAAEKIYLNGKL